MTTAPTTLPSLLLHSVEQFSTRPAVIENKGQTWTYADLQAEVAGFASWLNGIAPKRGARIAIYTQKSLQLVSATFGAGFAGCAFIPINPVLKAQQVGHILADSGATVLVTTSARLKQLQPVLKDLPQLSNIVLIDGPPGSHDDATNAKVHPWPTALPERLPVAPPDLLATDIAAILYTSGSTGLPKGVVLSHGNITCGADSVARYLDITERDRLLAVLPLSFDYGMNQIMSGILRGSCVVLLDYLLPRDVVRACARHAITGLAAVPPLWLSLVDLDWPEDATRNLRYVTNSGGAVPAALLAGLQRSFPSTEIFLMYGLTEAFRSTYLPPAQLAQRPHSIGRAIPNARIQVVRPDGTPCAVDEVGELVHEGPLVAQGYWRDAEHTTARFRPAPGAAGDIPLQPAAVWSGDLVRRDAEGYLYFVGRNDDMIKTSGYRVSPVEVEEVVYSHVGVKEAAVFGMPSTTLGQKIVLLVVCEVPDDTTLVRHLQNTLPTYMVPAEVFHCDSLPRNANGKIDRALLHEQLLSGTIR